MKIFRLAAALACMLIAFAQAGQATTIQVDSTGGDLDDNSCTLTNAFYAARQRVAMGTCPAGNGADVVILPANVTITVTSAFYSGPVNSKLPDVETELLLVGNGSTITMNPCGTLISVGFVGNLYVNGVSFQGGCSDVINVTSGELHVTHSTFAGNSAGTAISASFGRVEIDDSTFTDNGTSVTSRSTIITSGGSLNVRSSYFGNNRTSESGAAIRATVFSIENSTFHENGGGLGAIAVDVGGQGSISFSTIEGSVAGAVVVGAGGHLKMANNILTHAIGGGGVEFNCTDLSGIENAIVAIDHNVSDDYSCIGATVVSSRALVMFGDLGTYGGPTELFPLRSGSAAMNLANCTDAEGIPVSTDQRGTFRFNICDVGAFQHDNAVYPYSPPVSLGAGHVLIGDGSFVGEFTRAGQRVRSFYASPSEANFGVPGFQASDLDHIGMLAGHGAVQFQLYSVDSDTWGVFDLGASPSAQYIFLAHARDRWFAADYARLGPDNVLVLDSAGPAGSLTTCKPINTMQQGPDSNLYVICPSEIQVFDPITLQLVRSIDTSGVSSGNTASAGAIGSNGNIYLAESDGRLYRLDPLGATLGSTDCLIAPNATPCIGITSLSIADDDILFASSTYDSSLVVLIDANFSNAAVLPTGLGPGFGGLSVFALPVDGIFHATFE